MHCGIVHSRSQFWRITEDQPVMNHLAVGLSPQQIDTHARALSTVTEHGRPSTAERPCVTDDKFATTWRSVDSARIPTGLMLSLGALPLRLGRYEVRRLLGEGEMGAVYLAHDTELARDVALKIPKSSQSREAAQQILSEGRLMARSRHANICSVHDVGQLPNGPHYISMAYIQGMTLAEWARVDPSRPVRQKIRQVRNVAIGLDAVHQAGVIHRDVKPANIMIERDSDEPILMDFGLATTEQVGTRISPDGVLGTPAYMSPEHVAASGRHVGPASDVYSLGVVMYEMLAGRIPFEGTVTEVLQQVVDVEPPRPSRFREGLDRRLEAICLKAMAKRADRRYASAAALAAALAE